MHPEILNPGEFFLCPGFKLCTRACYLGVFIRDKNFKRDWLKERTHSWKWNIHTISKTSGKYPQESYAAVVHVIQLEWIFLRCITNNMGESSGGGGGALFYRYAPMPPKLPSTNSSTGQEERDLRRRGVQSGRVRGSQPGIGWSPSGGWWSMKVHRC